MTVGRFLRTPKGLLLILLAVLIAIAAPHEGLAVVAPGLLGAMAAAAVLDAVILRARRGRWEFPDGALLTAMLVAMVLSAQQPWYYAAATAALAVVSKYVIRTRAANVFNPAALAIVATFYIFQTGQSWWGALPNVSPWLQMAVVVAGVFIADRVNKLPLVLAFLGFYYGLFTLTSFVTSPTQIAEVYRTPDLQAAFFFAVFILTDPPTSPVRYPDQIVCAAIVAVVSFAVFMWVGAVYYLLAGVLAGNVWEAWRRLSHRAGARFPRDVADFLREVTPWRRPTLTAARSS